MELLRTDLLHMTTIEQNAHKEYLATSYVLLYYRTSLLSTRLPRSWKGPMRVMKGLNSRYTLLGLITGKKKDLHVSDMALFVFDSTLVNPLDVARRDQIIFSKLKILGHRGKLGHRKSLQFFVTWLVIMSHMILGNRMLICASLIISIPTDDGQTLLLIPRIR